MAPVWRVIRRSRGLQASCRIVAGARGAGKVDPGLMHREQRGCRVPCGELLVSVGVSQFAHHANFPYRELLALMKLRRVTRVTKRPAPINGAIMSEQTAAGAPQYFIGVDVQMSRACSYFVFDAGGTFVDSGWLAAADSKVVARTTGKIPTIKRGVKPLTAESDLRRIVEGLADGNMSRVAIGIDAPRRPLLTPRTHSYSAKRGWTPFGADDLASGRHCEVAIAVLKLATPQWTPLERNAKEWMKLGFRLFTEVADVAHVYEVFPSAAYAQLEHAAERALTTMDLRVLRPGPKDMVDAMVAAYTTREFVQGRGAEVGGKDGLGTIILPRPLGDAVGHAVLAYPA